ncbi:MAG: hypothetical protein RR447_07890 [Algoriella sp.]
MKRQTLFIVSKGEQPYYEFDVQLKTRDGYILRKVLARNELEAKQAFIDPKLSTYVGTINNAE